MKPLRVCTPEEFSAATVAERHKYVLAQIDATPYDWNQSDWEKSINSLFKNGDRSAADVALSCGTAFCYAGWAVELAGLKPSYQGIAFRAVQLLNLGEVPYARQVLFCGSNTREELDQIVAALTDTDPAVWAEFCLGMLVGYYFETGVDDGDQHGIDQYIESVAAQLDAHVRLVREEQ